MDYKTLKSEIDRTKRQYEGHRKSLQDSRCDKHGIGFNQDERFSGGKIILSLDSWTGYYGSSSCSRSMDVGDSFKRHLIKYLDGRVGIIIEAVVKSMESELQEYVSEEIAKTELYLQSLKDAGQTDSTKGQ